MPIGNSTIKPRIKEAIHQATRPAKVTKTVLIKLPIVHTLQFKLTNYANNPNHKNQVLVKTVA